MRHLLLSLSVFALVTGGAAIGYALHDRVTHTPVATVAPAVTKPVIERTARPGYLHHRRVEKRSRLSKSVPNRSPATNSAHKRQPGDDIADQLNAEQLR